jgi:uncharacterized membrane protein YjdF
VHPDWLGSPQHLIGAIVLTAAIVLLAPRAGITSPWLAGALGIGTTMSVEAVFEIVEYPLLYSGESNLSAYYDTVADIANSLAGAVLGAAIAVWIRLRRSGVGRSPG